MAKNSEVEEVKTEAVAEHIAIGNEIFSLKATAHSTMLLKRLKVNIRAARNGNNYDLIRYGYCIVAGVAKKEGKTFGYNVEQFKQALPANWKPLFLAVIE